jgi:hypothetical protein
MVQKYGEVSWEDEDSSSEGKKNTNSKDLFLRLDDGSNEMRLVTKPYQYLVHKYKKEGDPGFGQKVSCSKVHGECQLCDAAEACADPDEKARMKAKQRWLLGVISRKTGTYKILDISYAVYSHIKGLAKNVQRWGDPTKYDIDIVVNKNGGPTNYYSVQPLPKEALSATDQKIKDTDVDLDDLKRRVTPLTPENVQKRLDKINGVTSTASSKPAASKAKAPKAAAAPVVSEVSDADDDSFPAYPTEEATN